MQITCPQCSTTYDLDERVLPPGGAPVQCTRCSLVFNASPPKADRSGTQIFGAVKPPQEGAAPRSTQMFGAVKPPEDAPSPAPRGTQIFGAVKPPAQAPVQPVASPPPPSAPPSPAKSTQMFGAIKPPSPEAHDPVTPSAAIQAPSFEPTSTDAAAPVGGRRNTDRFAPKVLDPFEPVDLDAQPARNTSFEATMRSAQRRRVGVVLASLAAVILAVAGYFAYRSNAKRVPVTPPEAIALHSEAITKLRRDDPKSVQEAALVLGDLAKQYPAYAEARASHLISLLFELDDVRYRLARVAAEAAELNRQVERLQQRKEPSDWPNRVNALVDQLADLKKQSDPLVERGTVLDSQVNDVFRALQSDLADAKGERELQLVRAQAMYFGVKGSDQAIVLSERYRAMGGTEGWGDLAYAEYALNAHVAPDTRRQAIGALEALKSKDPSFIRLYVLVGRLALPEKNWDVAVTSFEGATTLNPEHELARALAVHAEKLRAADVETSTATDLP